MKKLLESLGYKPGVYRRYSDGSAWELCIARQGDVLRFYTKIGFSIEQKQEGLRGMLIRKGLLAQVET